MDPNSRPRFLAAYFDALSKSARRRGVWAVVPFWVLASGILGGSIAYLVPAEFWFNSRWDVSSAVYAGILTFNGLILALSWNAFSRIHETICATGFCSYLKEKDLLNGYITYITYVHGAQLLAISCSAVALFSVLLEVPYSAIERVIMALVIGSTAYAVKTASSSVSLMHDLIYQKILYDNHARGADNVVNIHGKGDQKS